MKKTITIVTNNRPDYFARMYATLIPQFQDWDIYVFSEPPATGILDVPPKDLPPRLRHIINGRRMGVHLNPFNALWYAFNDEKSDFNLHIEEDLLLSPDLVNMVDWYAVHAEEHPHAIALCPYAETTRPDTGADTLFWVNGWTSMSYAMTAKNWRNFFVRHFFDDFRGWDWSLSVAIQKSIRYGVLCPYFSRVMHIGAQGEHVFPSQQEQLFGNKIYYQGPPITEHHVRINPKG